MKRRQPAQLAIPLDADGAAGDGARSGGTEHNAEPTTPPAIIASELRFGARDRAHSVNLPTAPECTILDGSDRGRGEARAAELGQAPCKAVNDAPTLSADVEPAEDLDAGGGADVAPEDLGNGENPIVALQLAGAGARVELAPLADLALDVAARGQTPADVLLAQLGPGSRKAMRLALDRTARIASGGIYDRNTFPWGRLRYEHAVWIRNQLDDGYAPKYVNKCLAAFRGVLRQAFMLGHFKGPDAAEHYARAVAIRNVKGGRRRRPRLITDEKWVKLFGACDASPRGRRDSAFLVLLRQGGQRCWEAAGVDVADYDTAIGDLFVARAKGERQRTVHIRGAGRDALNAWLEVRGSASGPLLCPINRAGKLRIARISTDSLRAWWHRLCRRAGVAECWPHCARATYITEIANRYGPHVAQQLAGHARLDQTAEYIVPDQERLRQVSKGIFVPFKR